MRPILPLVLAAACAADPEPRSHVEHDTAPPTITEPTPGTTPAPTPAGPTCDGSIVPDGLHGHNVLVVLMDDMGLESVAAFGLHPDPPHTPNLDALAETGVRFNRAYSYPYCSPSRAATLTGRYGRRTGVATNVQMTTRGALPLEEVTFAEMARTSPFGPYETAAIGKWHLAGETTPDLLLHPNNLGFDNFDGTISNLDGIVQDDELSHDYFHWEQLTNGVIEHVDGYNTTAVVDAAIARIGAMQEPWVLYLAMHAAHGPMHIPPAELQGTGVVEGATAPELFGAVVEAADTELGRLLATVDPEVLTRTTIVVAGDNGTKAANVRDPWVLEGYKGSTADGGVRVPLFVTGPLVGAAGESDALVHLVDVFPTIADITCQPTVTGADGEPVVLDGQSLVPYLLDPTTPGARRSVYTEHVGPVNAGPPYTLDKQVLADHDYKLVRNAISGFDTFHAVGASPDDETPDLLAAGLDPAQQAAYDMLSAELDAIVADLVFDYAR